MDTTVVLDGETLGKPADAAEARAMLGRLAGRTHEVVSGLCLAHARVGGVAPRRSRASRFAPRAPPTSPRTWRPGEWEGRAGAYAIQGRGAALVERIEGDYLNVVGLPAAALLAILDRRFPGGRFG